MSKNLRFLMPFFLMGLSFAPGVAQVPSPSSKAKPVDNSKEAFIFESMHSSLRYENDGTGTREIAVQVRLQSEAGVQQLGLLTFGYSSANEQLEIGYVRVRKPDGTVVTTSAEDVQDMPSDITRLAPMYSDYRERHVAVKGLGVGDRLEYDVKTRITHPLVPGQFWFDYEFVKEGIILDEQLELNVPKDRVVNVKSTEVKPSIKDEGDRRIYLWKSANTQRIPNDEQPLITNPPPPPVQVSTFRTWEEVGAWWSGLERERVTPTPEIRAKAAELTKDAKTDTERVKAIYSFVATQFRYIGVSFGLGRYQPHPAEEVLHNAYGDCKDKHTLLASLLKAAGVEIYPALINSSLKIDPEVPSPGHFDHVISVIPLGKEWTWVDTTTEVAPFGFLSANLRDKQALVMPTGQPASLIKTPADPPFKNSVDFRVEGTLSPDGTLKAKIQRTDRGDVELVFRLAFRQTPQSSWKDLVQKLSYASGFGGDVSEVNISSPESTEQPFRMSYEYVRKEYGDWANHRILAPLQLCSLLELDDKTAKSSEPLKMAGPAEYDCSSKITVPPGYVPTLLPAMDLVRDFAEYHAAYSFKDGVYEAKHRLILKLRELPAASREDYKALQKGVSDESSLFTSFALGKEDLASQSGQMSADELNSAAAHLLDQNKDFTLARDLLVKATAKDPHHKFAWNNLGRAYAGLRNVDEAEAAYKKAIEVDPKDQYASKNLGSLYTRLGRNDEAVAIYRKYIEANPDDKDTYGLLGWTLNQMEKWDDAAQAYEKAAAMNPNNSYNYEQWAHALLKAGKVEEARQKLDHALQVDPSPMTLNNVAWERAEANLDLDMAESEAKSAVDKTASSLPVSPTLETPTTYGATLAALASYLDTLGWVYYHQGKLEEAQTYLLPADTLSPSFNPTITEHVAQVFARQDKFEDALKYYAWAQNEFARSGHADKQLEDYLTRKTGGAEQLAKQVVELRKSRSEVFRVRPTQGDFNWPKESDETKPSFVQIAVATDAGGAVADAKILAGKGDFRDAALEDARHLHLPPIAWPGHALPSVRTITFLYRPAGTAAKENSVKAWWTLGFPPADYVTFISPDGEHVMTVPPSIAAQMASTQGPSATVEGHLASTSQVAADFTESMKEGIVLRRGKDLDGAIGKFKEATQAAPDCDWCHGILAETLAQKGDREAAISEYNEVVRIKPEDPDAHFTLGAQYEALGATLALAGYHYDRQTHTNRPTNPNISKMARADYESAMEQYRLAYSLLPNDSKYREAYERMKQKLKRP